MTRSVHNVLRLCLISLIHFYPLFLQFVVLNEVSRIFKNGKKFRKLIKRNKIIKNIELNKKVINTF